MRFPGPAGELQGAWAAAEDPQGALLVIHENRGLTRTSSTSWGGTPAPRTQRCAWTCSQPKVAPGHWEIQRPH